MSIPCYIIEEHNEAFEVWLDAVRDGVMSKDRHTLLHFDDHSDMCVPSFESSINDLLFCKKTWESVAGAIGIATFIVPAIYLGIIDVVKWIKQDVSNVTHYQMYVCSLKNEGAMLMMGKLTNAIEEHVADTTLIPFVYSKTDEGNLLTKSMVTDHILLDIDLDYFSCIENPANVNPVVIEIMKSEYDEFNSNKHHPLIFLMNKIETRTKGGKYYYVLNDYSVKMTGNRKVSIEIIKERISHFKKTLLSLEVKPVLITVCRSRYSGYTPTDQWELIEEMVLEVLHEIYSIKENCLYV